TEVKESQETIQTHQGQLTGRVYANTDKFSSFSLESPNALDNIDQIIFAPISTTDTEFSQGARKWRNVVSQYFSEVQSKQPRVITLTKNNARATADFTGMNSSLIAQTRIKDVRLIDLARKGTRTNIHSKWRHQKTGETRAWNTKMRDSRRVGNFQTLQKSTSTPGLTDINSPLQEFKMTGALNSKTDLTKTKFLLEVIAEIVFVDAINYEYAGYGLKKIWLDSANVEPDLLTLARHEGSPTNSRTRTERNADIIKNMWDILLSHLQYDVYQVATAIKNQELALTLVSAAKKPAANAHPINKQLASRYFRVKNSEFEEFIISATDSLDALTQTTYSPITTNQAQLNSKQDGWNHQLKLALHHLSNQPSQTYIFATNNLAQADSSTATDDQNLVIQIDVKQMELYSRSAIR
ncbi:MAG: hypothetical protein ABJM37_01640, partial [Gilvibacter sp.]